MGKNTNAAKAAQLGMSWGAACNLLRKQVLFMLLERCGENVCFRCEQLIESADELTLEHKQPWLTSQSNCFGIWITSRSAIGPATRSTDTTAAVDGTESWRPKAWRGALPASSSNQRKSSRATQSGTTEGTGNADPVRTGGGNPALVSRTSSDGAWCNGSTPAFGAVRPRFDPLGASKEQLSRLG
jgi:hypothetical protein